MTLPVRYIEWHAAQTALDPKFLRQMREFDEAFARVERGESKLEDEFQLSTAEDLQAEIDRMWDENPGAPRRYKLPAHLHWTGLG